MSREVIMKFARGAQHTPVTGLQAVPMLIEEKSIMVANGMGGAVPYFQLRLYSRVGVPAIQQGDLGTDAVSGQQYRVSGTPIIFDQSLLQADVTRYPEGTP